LLLAAAQAWRPNNPWNQLYLDVKQLSSTNPIETVRHTQRNVKRWPDGDMRKRWTAAGMLQAEQQFRRVIGYTDLSKLVIAIERPHPTLESPNTTRHTEEVTASQDAAQLVTG
jgi:putative transposase